MSEQTVTARPVHENLDTAYVNLAALVRYLQERYFAGRIHVVLDEYEAEVVLGGSEPPRVRETDHTTGRQAEGEAALQRLFVRAREPGGVINVYDHSGVAAAEQKSLPPASPAWVAPARPQREPEELRPEDLDWSELLRVSGELVGTIERAALAAGADFASLFRDVRTEMADDYPFLDPGTGRFEYGNGEVWLRAKPAARAYVSGVSEALRRVVNKVCTGGRAASVRERVALELAVLARRRQAQLARFKFAPQLDRIAGTRVL